MPKIPSLLSVGKRELFSFWNVVWILFFAFVYILFSLFLLNSRLVGATIIATYSLQDKVNILLSLLEGLFTAFSPLDTGITLVSAVLVGINCLLIVKTMYLLEHKGKLGLSIGGATIIGIISTGCSSCGFSLLSILGFSTTVALLPFHGLELHVIALGLLLFSSWYMLKKLRENVYCKR